MIEGIKYKVFSVAVDTSMRLEKPLYYFRFKGVALKYIVSQDKQYTDCLTGHFPVSEYPLSDAYKLLTEFLSLWSFERDEIVMPCCTFENGTLFPDEKSALKVNMIVQARVKVPKTTTCPTIVYLPKIETDIQDKVVRLYRQARSCVNVYSQLLFFWHALVYPSQNDKDAQDYIQSFIDSQHSEYGYVYSDIDWLIKYKKKHGKGALSENLSKDNFGEYVREDVRNAIAHIVRKWGASLDIDNIDQQAHIGSIGKILRYISRYKIRYTHSLSLDKPHGMDYFMTLKNPDSE
ncbi:hypothetical protein ES703_72444 [subsurface metagenome]